MPKLTGWIPDRPDSRDVLYASFRPRMLSLVGAPLRARRVDLRETALFDEVYDQGNLGSCGSQAWCAAISFANAKLSSGEIIRFSRLAHYYDVRVRMGTVAEDSGQSIRDGIKTVAKVGIGMEHLWPYVEAKFQQRPPRSYYEEGAHRASRLRYFRLLNLGEILDCLAEGWPVVFGMSVHESILSVRASDPVVPEPGPNDAPAGGHAMVLVGYDRPERQFWLRNSWGRFWGDGGHARISYRHVMEHGMDFWTIRRVAR